MFWTKYILYLSASKSLNAGHFVIFSLRCANSSLLSGAKLSHLNFESVFFFCFFISVNVRAILHAPILILQDNRPVQP